MVEEDGRLAGIVSIGDVVEIAHHADRVRAMSAGGDVTRCARHDVDHVAADAVALLERLRERRVGVDVTGYLVRGQIP